MPGLHNECRTGHWETKLKNGTSPVFMGESVIIIDRRFGPLKLNMFTGKKIIDVD